MNGRSAGSGGDSVSEYTNTDCFGALLLTVGSLGTQALTGTMDLVLKSQSLRVESQSSVEGATLASGDAVPLTVLLCPRV